jgi:predicted ABC-type transport system involved in lysophospholipase L1 biosynthesis ATPase subunit
MVARMNAPIIEARGVALSFGETPALRGAPFDARPGESVMRLMVEAARERGTTVVLVTHEPRVAAHADREVDVRDGAVHALAGGRGRA